MKKLVLAAVGLLLASGSALTLTTATAEAAPAKSYHQTYKYNKKYVAPKRTVGKVTLWERMAIARSQASLNALIRRAHADGRVTPYERSTIRVAQQRHDALVRRARYS